MHELKKAIERVLAQQGCGVAGCKNDIIAVVFNEDMQHLREIYEAVKERM